jgi:uncharacterized membrane protein YeiH
MMDIPPLLASFMGVLTGAMGGILRDVLCDEAPVVFNSQLYATVLWLGSLLFIALLNSTQDITLSNINKQIFFACHKTNIRIRLACYFIQRFI